MCCSGLMWGDKGLYLPAFQMAAKEASFYQSPFLPRLALSDTVRMLRPSTSASSIIYL